MIRLLMLAAAYAMSVVRAIDLYFFRTVLLIHGNGANGSTAIRDSSFSNKQITANGNAQISTAQSKFGGSSIYFDGTGDYLIQSGVGAESSFGTGDVTMEAWVFIAGNSAPDLYGTRGASICSTWPTGNTHNGWIFGFLASTTTTGIGLQFDSWDSGGINATIYRSSTTVSQGVWHHIAAIISAGTRSLFVDGVQQTATLTNIGTGYASLTNHSTNVIVGATLDTNYPLYLNGYIDDLRITKGRARYTSNFTPPALQLPDLWADTYFDKVVLSLHGKSMVDSSPLPKTITANGNAAVSTAQSKFGGSSLYFDGTGDYLTLGGGATVTLSGDFTFECWVYPLALQFSCIVDTRTIGAQLSFTFIFNPDGSVGSYLHPTNYNSPVGAYSANVWTHLAFSRQGSVARVFSNGSLIYTFTYTPPGSGGNLFRIGTNIDAGYFVNGYIDDLRLTNGVARYTANFTPPDQQFFDEWADMYLDSVVLLLHGDGPNASTVIVDSSTLAKTITANGNAQISTAQSKFGGSSLYFDGTGDYLTTPDHTDFDLGANNFTVECWVRIDSTLIGSGFVVGQWGDAGSCSWSMGVTASGVVFLETTVTGTYTAPRDVISAASAVPVNTWVHLAMTRYGDLYTLWANGASVGTTTISGTLFNSTAVLTVGSTSIPDGYFKGYIDDLRITKGVARYTSNFTPPILAFPHGS